MQTHRKPKYPPTHPMDDGMLTLSSIDEIHLTASSEYKGGLLEGAMPEDVRDFFLKASTEVLAPVFRKTTKIDGKTGMTDLSIYPDNIFPNHVVDFIDSISFEFNKAYPGECVFGVQDPRAEELNNIFPRFHFDTRDNEPEATYRGLICVSDDDCNHESEWVATNGLSQDDLLNHYRGVNKPLNKMKKELQGKVQVNKPRDLFIFKGLSRQMNDAQRNGSLHRSPPFKHDYRDRSIRRVGLVWNKEIEVECNMG